RRVRRGRGCRPRRPAGRAVHGPRDRIRAPRPATLEPSARRLGRGPGPGHARRPGRGRPPTRRRRPPLRRPVRVARRRPRAPSCSRNVTWREGREGNRPVVWNALCIMEVAMKLLRRLALAVVVLVVLAFALIGALTLTRGTPVSRVRAV